MLRDWWGKDYDLGWDWQHRVFYAQPRRAGRRIIAESTDELHRQLRAEAARLIPRDEP